jgi:hypothetical protein
MGGHGSRTLAYRVVDAVRQVVEVYDLDFAAYCSMEGLQLKEMLEDGRIRGRYKFVFSCSEDEVVRMSLVYTNSPCAKFADAVRRLKKAVRVT